MNLCIHARLSGIIRLKYGLIIMKLSMLLVLVGVFQVSAYTFAQRVELDVRNASLESVLLNLQEQSGYDFLFNASYFDLANPVTLKVQNRDIEDALPLVFADQPFDYQINGRIVTLQPRKPVEESRSVLQQLISGSVTDTLGIPLPGVSVLVKGTSRGTATDEEGNFQLQADPGEVLQFQMVGYLSQEISITSSADPLQVVMRMDASNLDGVVLVAYGTQKKISVAGAIASIQTEEINQSPAANLAVSLAGRLPGLTALQRSGEPGRDHTALLLRGMGTLNGSTPIILVDGVEREMTYIDPNEVESVS